MIYALVLCSCLTTSLTVSLPVLNYSRCGFLETFKRCFYDQVTIGPGVTCDQLATFLDSKHR